MERFYCQMERERDGLYASEWISAEINIQKNFGLAPLGHNVWNGANERERKREIGTDQTGRRLDPNTVIVISETQRTARRTPINNTTGS